MLTAQQIFNALSDTGSFAHLEFIAAENLKDKPIEGLSTIDQASTGQLACVFDAKFFDGLKQTQAACVIIPKEAQAFLSSNTPAIVVDQAYLAYAYASKLLATHLNSIEQKSGIEASAQIAESAIIDPTAYIGHFAVIEENCVIGANTYIANHVSIGADTKIGEHCKIYPHASIYYNCLIRNYVTVHSGTVIGSDGFGFAPNMHKAKNGQGLWEKIAQIGKVEIANFVEIGANTCVDRGAIHDTYIGNGVIIDNLVQIAHNVKVGDNSAIAGCVGIAGSSEIGEGCRLAGGAGLAGHLSLADNVVITGMSMVTKSITEAGSYSAGTALQSTQEWRKNAAQFRHLSQLKKRVLELEKTLQNKIEKNQ